MKKTSDSTQSPDTLKLKKHRLIIAVLSVLAVLLLLAGLARLIGPPLMDAVRNKESFRLWIDAQGPWKYLIMVGIMTAQIIVALVPGAPVEMAAGYAFGLWGGVGLCLIGTAIGNAIVILLTRVFGMRMVRLFMDDDRILALTQRLTREQKRMDLMIFLLFLIPGTPKDLMTYVAGLLPIPLARYLILTSFARIPSMIGNALGGSMLGRQNYRAAMITMAVVVLISLIVFFVYRNHERLKAAAAPLPPAQTGESDEPDKKGTSDV